MNANFKYLIYCFIALLAFSCKEDVVNPEEDLAYFKESVENIVPVIDMDAVYSPEGSQIAFCRIPMLYEQMHQEGLYLMNSDGSNLRFLFQGIAGKPKFSPDGKKIAFSTEFGLAIIDFEKRIFKHCNDRSLGGSIDWALNGKEMVCERYSEEDNGGIVIGIIDTSLEISNFRKITKSKTGDARYPSYSNDGKNVYFFKYSLEDKSKYKSLQKVDIKTLKTIVINDDEYNSFFTDISQVENKLVHNVLDYNIIIRDLDGSFIKRVPLRGHTPSFHPNGKTILFSSPDSAFVGSRLATYNFETKSIQFIRYY